MKRIIIGVLIGAAIVGAAWAQKVYTVNSLACVELRVTWDQAGNLIALRGDVVPLQDGERINDVRSYGFTLEPAQIPAGILTTLATLRERAELYAEAQTGWVTTP